MEDKFEGYAPGLESPATRHMQIAPSDTEDLPHRYRVIRCLTGGTAVVRDDAGVEIAYSVVAGESLIFRPARIMATGTTATLVGWW